MVPDRLCNVVRNCAKYSPLIRGKKECFAFKKCVAVGTSSHTPHLEKEQKGIFSVTIRLWVVEVEKSQCDFINQKNWNLCTELRKLFFPGPRRVKIHLIWPWLFIRYSQHPKQEFQAHLIVRGEHEDILGFPWPILNVYYRMRCVVAFIPLTGWGQNESNYLPFKPAAQVSESELKLK